MVEVHLPLVNNIGGDIIGDVVVYKLVLVCSSAQRLSDVSFRQEVTMESRTQL